MRCFLRVLAVLAALVVLLIGVAYLITDSEVRVERSTTIAAPPEAIFPHVNRLEAWEAWSPWNLRDPEMEVTYEGPPEGVGAISSWVSETQGSGTQTIRESVSHERIVTELDFGDMGTATSDWTFVADGDGTRVTWGMVSHTGNHLGFRIFGLFLDKMVGADYEAGLSKLKELVEDPT